MPFVKVKTSAAMTDAQEVCLKEAFGEAIALVPGKSEEYLLLEFESDAHLWIRGHRDEPAAYIEAAIFGNEGHAGYAAFTQAVTATLGEVLEIAPANVFIKFEDITGWSTAGMYIDRRQFG